MVAKKGAKSGPKKGGSGGSAGDPLDVIVTSLKGSALRLLESTDIDKHCAGVEIYRSLEGLIQAFGKDEMLLKHVEDIRASVECFDGIIMMHEAKLAKKSSYDLTKLLKSTGLIKCPVLAARYYEKFARYSDLELYIAFKDSFDNVAGFADAIVASDVSYLIKSNIALGAYVQNPQRIDLVNAVLKQVQMERPLTEEAARVEARLSPYARHAAAARLEGGARIAKKKAK